MSGDAVKCNSCGIELDVMDGVVCGECIPYFSRRLGRMDASTPHQDIRFVCD